MKFTKISQNTFSELQLNAGVLLNSFDPATKTFDDSAIIGATSGGVKFNDTPTFADYGEDIDNCPKNTKELKRITGREVKLGGTFKTVNKTLLKQLAAACDSSSDTSTGLTSYIPRDTLKDTDFGALWWVGDYSDKNGDENGGFIAIKLINALNTAGFSLQTADKEKGSFAFEFTGHYSISDQDTVPYEIYLQEGSDEPSEDDDDDDDDDDGEGGGSGEPGGGA